MTCNEWLKINLLLVHLQSKENQIGETSIRVRAQVTKSLKTCDQLYVLYVVFCICLICIFIGQSRALR